MTDGSAIEVATVGNEGVLGYAVAYSSRKSANRVIVQIAGDSLWVRAERFQKIVLESPALQDLFARYNTAYMFQMSQAVACNGLHQLEKRCCKWLLMTRDRVSSNEFPLTHEYLGMMLGVRRASVSEVLAPLQSSGLLRCNRGVITLLDPKGIEALTCECYFLMRDEYDRLLGPRKD